MALPHVVSSGENPISAGTEWKDLLVVEGYGKQVNWLNIVNEGDTSGYWRLVNESGETTPVRLPAGAGDIGYRRSSIIIPCPNFSGTLQVRADKIGESLANLFAFGMK